MQRDECSINPMLAVLYFCIFMLVCTYIMVQLVIGIVLDAIQVQSFLDEMDVGQEHSTVLHSVQMCTLYKDTTFRHRHDSKHKKKHKLRKDMHNSKRMEQQNLNSTKAGTTASTKKSKVDPSTPPAAVPTSTPSTPVRQVQGQFMHPTKQAGSPTGTPVKQVQGQSVQPTKQAGSPTSTPVQQVQGQFMQPTKQAGSPTGTPVKQAQQSNRQCDSMRKYTIEDQESGG
eukprot:1157110-Pelagomonas_calceolata.AAC.4